MKRKFKILPVFENVEITDIATEGRGIGRVGELVVFVEKAVPGDVVDVQVTKKKSAFAEGKIAKMIKPSTDRIDAVCSYFGTCGGCKWQYLTYEKQLFYKQKQVVDCLTRISKVDLPEIELILGSEKTINYRNKLEFTFSNKRWLTAEEVGSVENYEDMSGLGFHIPGRFDKVLDINECFLQEEPSNSIRNAVRKYCLEQKIEFADLRNHGGILRNLTVRSSSNGELMVILSISEKNSQVDGLLEFIKTSFPQISSLMYVINTKLNDTISDLDVICYSGNDHIMEQMEDLKFRIGPKSFYQTNSNQAYRLYSITREFANISKDDVVYDLYTGTGTIANFVARLANKVVGVEYVPEAIDDAHENSKLNNIDNTVFYAGDMAKVFTEEFCNTNGLPDIIITDPPRAGMHADVITQMLKLKAKRIVYVSCNPSTQARDIALLSEDYAVTKVQPVDMFPHTEHVENVVLLVRK